MSRSYPTRSLFACLLALCLIFGAGCSENDETPSEPTTDTTPPEVVDHYPAEGAVDIDRNVLIWIEFSESMDESSVTDSLTVSPAFGCLTSWNGTVLDITPTDLLAAATAYTITIDSESADPSGNEMGSDYSFTFTTGTGGDYIAPTVLSTSPADGEQEVAPLQPIEIQFSEPMDLTSVENSIEIDPYTEILDIEWFGTTMEIYHDVLPQDSEITVTVGTLAADLAGNHLAEPYTWSFTTLLDDVRPYLLSASPADGATGVLTSLNSVVLTFSETMNPEFEMPASNLDARFQQAMGDMDNPWNEDLTEITIDLVEKLLPGCTYWARFGSGVTDLAGNIIDPDPTDYEFTTVGAVSYFPIQNNYAWHYLHSEDVLVTRKIENYAVGTGTFDLLTEFEVSPGLWATGEIWHMDKNTTEIMHMGRDQYEDGTYQFTMTWNEPIVYMRLPIDNYAGDSWSFETFALLSPSTGMDSLTIAGMVEIEDFPVNLTADYDPLYGTFKGCYVHHLSGNMVFYLEGAEVGNDSFHMITWYSPGAGPVKIIEGPAFSDTMYVYDWEL